MINFAITTSTSAKIWKLAKVFPVHKRGKTYELDDFRAISILPVMSKIIEILLKWQMQKFLDDYDIRCEFQSGFRAGHSTATALLKVTSVY